MAGMTGDYMPILLPTGYFPIQQTSRLWLLPLIFYNPGFFILHYYLSFFIQI